MNGEPKEDQTAVLAFLEEPATHEMKGPVTRIETHGAIVFLAGENVYKVKRAVHFPYMDLSTLEKRKAACEAEVRVNRLTAPNLYLGIVPIVRGTTGLTLGKAGTGDIVEWAVHLRRFDEMATLDRVAERGRLDAKLVDRLADVVLAAHRQAACRRNADATASLRRVLTESLDEIDASPDLFHAADRERLRSSLVCSFDLNEPLLHRRETSGAVRRCHGDLHLRNIVLIDETPVLFDAIEFDEAIATTDTLYDLAFLIMDLCERGLQSAACRLLNGYLWQHDDEAAEIAGLALLPLFLALRAIIRSKVAAARFHLEGDVASRGEALAYLAAALRFVKPFPVRLIAVGGLSGTGKSTLSTAIAPALGAPPGALHLRSDIERKRLFKVSRTDRLSRAAYDPAVSRNIYGHLRELVAKGLRADRCVVVDATYLDIAEQRAIEDVAREAGVPFLGLWLEAPLAILKARVEGRENDVSDATAEVVESQTVQVPVETGWQKLDATLSIDRLRAGALAMACADPS